MPHARASFETVYPEKPKPNVKVEEMADACAQVHQKDQICSLVLQVRQIGKDAIEAVKEYVALSETEYTLLTIANAAATQRVRLRSGIYNLPNAGLTLDIKKDETNLIFDHSF